MQRRTIMIADCRSLHLTLSDSSSADLYIATAAMDEATRSAWSRERGLYPAELDAWKQDAIAGLGEPRAASAVEARQDRRRVKELERELHRKDKALAETAALLVLSKKLAAVFNDGEDV